MKKDKFNSLFRDYVRSNLTPNQGERNFVSAVYHAVMDVLGEPNCFQIGSYARFTAITPLHDLDVLYEIAKWSPDVDPGAVLREVHANLSQNFVNPTLCQYSISLQTHSVTITFASNGSEVFSVDVVPAYTLELNEFGKPKYMVPEITRLQKAKRSDLYKDVASGQRKIGWIKSDPKGYNQQSTDLNAKNDDYRKTVKFVKGWRNSCKSLDEDFPIKSFHIEQILYGYFIRESNATIFDGIFEFFAHLDGYIEKPQIPDRADRSIFIDQYLSDLTSSDKDEVLALRDCFMIKLEDFEEGSDVAELLSACKRKRASIVEKYLFDYSIPTLTEEKLTIRSKALRYHQGGFRESFLTAIGTVNAGRKIEFTVPNNAPSADLFKWKVKNDDSCPQPRGEINDHQTSQFPESTKYIGNHYVECFAIRNGVCIAKTRQTVRIPY